VGGMTALRMEVVEDLGLAWMVKRAGGRSILALGPGLAKIRWIRGTFGIVNNMEKNGLAIFPVPDRALFGGCLCGIGDCRQRCPWLAMAAGEWATAAGLLTYIGNCADVSCQPENECGCRRWRQFCLHPPRRLSDMDFCGL
jgi:hypothetical protein